MGTRFPASVSSPELVNMAGSSIGKVAWASRKFSAISGFWPRQTGFGPVGPHNVCKFGHNRDARYVCWLAEESTEGEPDLHISLQDNLLLE